MIAPLSMILSDRQGHVTCYKLFQVHFLVHSSSVW